MRADIGASDTATMAMDAIIGDYAGFFAQQKGRLAALGIEIAGYPLSHLALRTETLDAYLVVRERIEAFCVATSRTSGTAGRSPSCCSASRSSSSLACRSR
jgi:hypothetical protein